MGVIKQAIDRRVVIHLLTHRMPAFTDDSPKISIC
jgi:hypothetical protein